MTKVLRYFLSVIFFGVLVTSSCKKYPDGPLLSISTKKQRLGATWNVEYFSINGHDSTTYLKNKTFYGMYEFVVSHDSHDSYYNSSAPGYSTYGKWYFLNKNNDLKVTFVLDSSHKEHLGPYHAESCIWEIRKLTKKELWLKTNYSDGREYFVKFKLHKKN